MMVTYLRHIYVFFLDN